MVSFDVWCVIEGKVYSEMRSFESVESAASVLNLLRKAKYRVLHSFMEQAILDDGASVDGCPNLFVSVIRRDRLIDGARPTVKVHRFYIPFYFLNDDLDVVAF